MSSAFTVQAKAIAAATSGTVGKSHQATGRSAGTFTARAYLTCHQTLTLPSSAGAEPSTSARNSTMAAWPFDGPTTMAVMPWAARSALNIASTSGVGLTG